MKEVKKSETVPVKVNKVSSFKKIFILDDRTGIISTSKLIRWLTWSLGALFVLTGLFLVISHVIELDDRDIQILGIVKDFLIFLIGFVESAYQVNRGSKMKLGNAPLATPEKVEEIPQG
jgi:hypothetical protein